MRLLRQKSTESADERSPSFSRLGRLKPNVTYFSQKREFGRSCGAANLGCRRLSAGDVRASLGCKLKHAPPSCTQGSQCIYFGRNVETPAAVFQPALAECEDLRIARKSRLKGGCRQDCLARLPAPQLPQDRTSACAT